MPGRERWDHLEGDFQVTRDSDLITTKESENNLQKGELTPGVRRAENTTEAYVYLHHAASRVESLGI